MEEKEVSVEERPATHKKKFQMVVIAAFVVIVVLLIVAVFNRINGTTQIEVQKTDQVRATDALNPEQQRVKFDEKLRQEQAELERQQKTGLPAGTSKEDETIARLRAELEAEKAKIQRTPAGGRFSPNAPAKESWADTELDRVRSARYAPSTIDLGFSRSSEAGSGLGTKGSLASSNGNNAVLQAAQQRLARYESAMNGNAGQAPTSLLGAAQFGGGSPLIGQAVSEMPQGPKVGQYLLPTAAVIKAALDQKAISDYPGPYRCRIVEDVYDVSHRYILIPKGSACKGETLRITNVNEPIQARMGMNISWVILPDGRRISFKSQAMLDREGVNAVKGDVDRHLLAQFLGVAAFAMVASETEYNTQDTVTSEGVAGAVVRDKSSSIAEKYINLVPTITLKYGDRLRIFIEEEMYIYPWRRVGERYLN